MYNIIEKYLKNDNINKDKIGSNDGISIGLNGELIIDPLFNIIKNNDNITALLVEPVPYLFEKLKNNYGESNRFIFENVAINDGTEQTFYWIDESVNDIITNLPFWFNQIGSFNRQHIIKHLNGILEPYITETNVHGLTLDGLFEKNNIQEIEMLHIDTEGYDWIVLSQLNLLKYNPTIILLEHLHLDDVDKKSAIKFLNDKYVIFEYDMDYLAINKDKILNDDLELYKEIIKDIN